MSADVHPPRRMALPSEAHHIPQDRNEPHARSGHRIRKGQRACLTADGVPADDRGRIELELQEKGRPEEARELSHMVVSAVFANCPYIFAKICLKYLYYELRDTKKHKMNVKLFHRLECCHQPNVL